MTFTERASLLTARHIPVVPVEAGQKRCTLKDWPTLATLTPAWTGDYNTAAVCLNDGICVLDVDSLDLALPQQPTTFTVSSASGRPHYYFKQTERSRALGNRSATGLFDFQQHRKYVVGPGSVLEDGRTYDVTNPAEIALLLGPFGFGDPLDSDHPVKVLQAVLLVIWIVGPPVWFWYEFFYLYKRANNPEDWDRFKHGQDQSAKIWLALVTVLFGPYFGKDFKNKNPRSLPTRLVLLHLCNLRNKLDPHLHQMRMPRNLPQEKTY